MLGFDYFCSYEQKKVVVVARPSDGLAHLRGFKVRSLAMRTAALHPGFLPPLKKGK